MKCFASIHTDVCSVRRSVSPVSNCSVVQVKCSLQVTSVTFQKSLSPPPMTNAPRTGGIHMCGCLESGTPLPLCVTEIARGDVRLTTDRPLRYGTPISLVMYQDLISGTVPNRGIVHWCRPSTIGWELGVYLNAPIPENMMSNSWWELRDSLRFSCNWGAWLQIPDVEARKPMQILDYSLCGMRLHCETRLAMGVEVSVCTSSSQHAPPVLVGTIEHHDASTSNYGCFLPHETGRFLPGLFNQNTALHVETPCIGGMNVRTSLLPEMIDTMPTGGFALKNGSYSSDGTER